jgi:hypothetical protein
MPKFIVVAAALTLTSLSLPAAPCAPGTLDSYIALGSEGCLLGSVVVSNFAYHAKSAGGAMTITASDVSVTPLLAPTAVTSTVGLQFAAPWSVVSQQGQRSVITYKVSSASVSQLVQQVRLDGEGFTGGQFTAAIVSESVATPAAAYSLKVYMQCTEVCRSNTSASTVITSSPSLVIDDNVSLHSTMGSTSITGFTDWFVVCLACV